MPLYKDQQLRTIAFPIGGIGTGCFSLSGNGELIDWEIFHRPNKQCLLPNTFFSLWTQSADGTTDARVLSTYPDTPKLGEVVGQNFYGLGHGVRRETGAGLRHMDKNTFRGEYPFAWVDFEDDSLPVQVSMMAYNPMIPLNVQDSGLPVGIFEFTIQNTSAAPVNVALAANLFNALGYRGHGTFTYVEDGEFKGTGEANYNRFAQEGNLSAIVMESQRFTPDQLYGGSMALATTWADTDHQTAWFRGAWYDALQYFWDEFSTTGRLKERTYDEPSQPDASDTGSLAMRAHIEPGQSVKIPVYFVWYFPNFIKYWIDGYREYQSNPPTWRVPYAQCFSDALDVARYVGQNEARLRGDTQKFHDTLFGSTVAPEVLDAVSSQMSILKSTTVLLLEDGTMYGWEGVHGTSGSCEGSCAHVWNYAITHAYLFPELERSMRASMYHYSTDDAGRMTFRLQIPLGVPPKEFHPAADGQMGNVMQVYRDWKLSGDSEWLRGVWPKVKKSLEYAWNFWDYNQDGVMEGLQHNTYDIEFYGPNTMMESWYIGALRCAAAMADALGDGEACLKYTALADAGQQWTEANLFNGEYYEQHVDPEASQHSAYSVEHSLGGQREGNPKYQYGAGCLSDQVIGAWMARVNGQGHILDEAQTKATLAAIFKYNFRTSLRNHNNAQRIYAYGDEAALLLCTWPRGGRPDLPFVYSDEVWTGIEYQVASHMIYEGLVDEGVAIVKAVRNRYDGKVRNPWNEIECGNHYSRALASWSVLLALSGFEADLTRDYLGFQPVQTDFRSFWSTGTGWGSYGQADHGAELRVEYGQQRVKTWKVGRKVSGVTLNGKAIAAGVDGNVIMLDEAVTLKPGDVLQAI